MADKIPDEIMREAEQIADQRWLDTFEKSALAKDIARALMARDACLQEQVETLTAQLADMASRYNKACVDIDAKDYHAEAAGAERDRLREALEPFAEAWDVAVHHEDLVRHLTLGQLGELAAHEVSGVHFRRARAALQKEPQP